jgi:hypothetical protein
MELLNANDRYGHWAHRQRITATLRETAGWLARAQRIPRLSHAHITAAYCPPDNRRRDPANWQPSFKACVDGLVDAGVLADDDATHVTGPDPRLGEPWPRGRIVLTITEEPAVRAAAAQGRTGGGMSTERAYPLVDARCGHPRCDEKNVYRMVGYCSNCGNRPLLVLISAGHKAPYGERCPKCGNYDVRCDRLAEDDELPLAVAADG